MESRKNFRRYFFNLSFLLLLSCKNNFHQSQTRLQKQKEAIRHYINAEDSRDSVILKNLLADTITRYWNMEDPTRQKIISFYKDYWTKNKFSKNIIQSVSAMAINTYMVKTFFTVQRIHADTALHFKSIIVYKLNTNDKIVYVAKE